MRRLLRPFRMPLCRVAVVYLIGTTVLAYWLPPQPRLTAEVPGTVPIGSTPDSRCVVPRSVPFKYLKKKGSPAPYHALGALHGGIESYDLPAGFHEWSEGMRIKPCDLALVHRLYASDDCRRLAVFDGSVMRVHDWPLRRPYAMILGYAAAPAVAFALADFAVRRRFKRSPAAT